MEYKALLVQLPLSGKEPLLSGFPHTYGVFPRWIFWLQAGPRRFGGRLAFRPLPLPFLLNAACSLVRVVVGALSEVQNQSLIALVDGVSVKRCICWTVRCHQSNGGWFLFLIVDLLLITEASLVVGQACLSSKWERPVWNWSRQADFSSRCELASVHGLGAAAKYVNQTPFS